LAPDGTGLFFCRGAVEVVGAVEGEFEELELELELEREPAGRLELKTGGPGNGAPFGGSKENGQAKQATYLLLKELFSQLHSGQFHLSRWVGFDTLFLQLQGCVAHVWHAQFWQNSSMHSII